MNRSIHSKQMNSRDILLRITSYCDEVTLQNMLRTSILVNSFSQDQYFWKMRLQNIIRIDLNLMDTDWMEAYYIIEPVLGWDNSGFFHDLDTSNEVAVKIIFDLDYDPSEHGGRLLEQAAGSGHTETLKLLLSDKRIDPSRAELLTEACENGHIEVVRLLLQNKRIDPSDEPGLVLVASREGHIEVVRLLLEDKRIDPEYIHDYLDTETVLSLACENGHTEVVRLLLADRRIDPSENSNHPILVACSGGHLEVVKLLLLDSRVDPSDDSNSCIIEACSRGYLEIVKLLLAHDPSCSCSQEESCDCDSHRVDPSDQENRAIIEASSEGHLEIVKLLLEDERVDPTEHESDALRRAVGGGYIKIVKLLLPYSGAYHLNKMFLLSVDCQYKAVKLVSIFLEHSSVDPSADKNQALMQACSSGGREEVVKLLLDHPRVIVSSHCLILACKRAMNIRSDCKKTLDILLRDKRMNVDELTKEVDFKLLLQVSFSVIQDQAIGFYQNRCTSEKPTSYYRSLLLFLILRRPSFEEVLEWILLHPNKEMILAARSLSDSKIDHRSILFTAYRGFLLLSVSDDLSEVKQQLRSEVAQLRGIALASGLVGAFLGGRDTGSKIGYKQIYDVLK